MQARNDLPHIQVVQENTKGSDYIIGDIHGSIDTLNLTLSKLKTEDRLFIVGDLADRGPGSYQVYLKILQVNVERFDKGLPPQIHVARGNHEDILLEYCQKRLEYEEALQKFCLATGQDLEITRSNLSRLEKEREKVEAELDFFSDIDGNDADSKYEQALTRAEEISNELNQFPQQLLEIHQGLEKKQRHLIKNGGNWATNLSLAEFKGLSQYISTIPYILHVKGKDPFNVVHADLPFSQEKLMEKIGRGDLTLTEKEREHATWARVNSKKHPILGRLFDLIRAITYCGHSIGGGVRIDSNHVNTDIGTYDTACACLINHQKRQCEIIGDPANRNKQISEKIKSSPDDIARSINVFLKNRAALLAPHPPINRQADFNIKPSPKVPVQITTATWSADDLSNAAKKGNIPLLRSLIQKGMDLNQTNEQGWTPIQEAALLGQTEAVEILALEGANWDIKSTQGKDLSQLAPANQQVQVAKILAGLKISFTILNNVAAKLDFYIHLLENLQPAKNDARREIAADLIKSLGKIQETVSDARLPPSQRIKAVEQIDNQFTNASLLLKQVSTGSSFKKAVKQFKTNFLLTKNIQYAMSEYSKDDQFKKQIEDIHSITKPLEIQKRR